MRRRVLGGLEVRKGLAVLLVSAVVSATLIDCSSVFAGLPSVLWRNNINGCFFYCVRETRDAGFIGVGWNESYDSQKIVLVKTDSFGNESWRRTFSFTGNDYAFDVRETSDGGYVVPAFGGHFPLPLQGYLIKTRSDGSQEWVRTYNIADSTDAGTAMQTDDGGYVVAGYTYDLTKSGEFYLLKVKPNGDIAWSKTYGGLGLEYGNVCQQTSDGGYFVAGFTMSYGAGGRDYWLVKTDSTGIMQWNRTYGTAQEEVLADALQTRDGGYILIGTGGVIKTDSGGNQVWVNTHYSTNFEARIISEVQDGGYVIALGWSGLVKLNANGNEEWTLTPGFGFSCVASTSDGGFITGDGDALAKIGSSVVIQNVCASQRPGTTFVDISYDLESATPCNISVSASADGGVTWSVPTSHLTGDIVNVAGGENHKINWDAGSDWPNQQTDNMVIRIFACGDSADSPSFLVDTVGINYWFLRAWADKNGNHIYDTGEEIGDANVYYGGRTPSYYKGRTASNGTICIHEPLRKGWLIFVQKVVYQEPAIKAGHESVDNVMFNLWLDSDGGGYDQTSNWDGTWATRIVTTNDMTKAASGEAVSIHLGHPVFEWNLVVASHISSSTFITQLQEGFRNASDYLYDVTDGQMKFGKVAIYSNVAEGSEIWNNADMVIYTSNDYQPNSDNSVNGIRDSGAKHMFFGNDWTGWSDPPSVNPPHFPNQDVYFWTIVHEFGHYGLDLYDEYINGWGSKADWATYRANHPDEVPDNYGLMDDQYNSSEMSSYNDYLPSYGPFVWGNEITKELMQHDLFWGFGWYPCWQWVENNFEKTYNGIPVEIIVPPYGYFRGPFAEDRTGPEDIPPPYETCEPFLAPETIRGLALTGTGIFSDSTVLDPMQIQVSFNGKPAPGSPVLKKPKGSNNVNFLGVTDTVGRLRAYDISEGDMLVARYRGMESAHVVTAADLLSSININIQNPKVQIYTNILQTDLTDDLGLVIYGSVSTVPANQLTITINSNKTLAENPEVVVHLNDGPGINVTTYAIGDNRYSGTLDIGDAVGGTIELNCDSNDGQNIATTDLFALEGVTPSAYIVIRSRETRAEFHLQPGSTTVDCVGVIYTSFAPTIIPDGFDKIRVGPIFSALLGETTDLNGTAGVVNITYSDTDIMGVDQTSIRLYGWDDINGTWNILPSGVSVSQHVVSATITNLGVFGLFADSTDDTNSPGRITDFVATTDTNDWNIRLYWTAVGDDNLAGTATTYILKFSTSEINETNWVSCSRYHFGIVPKTAGATESCTIKMPDPGVYYYFAIMAQDEAGNLSPLSNVTAAKSHWYDTDEDGMPDQWEGTYGLNPLDSNDSSGDADYDGLSNLQEYLLDTNPASWDTDGDGMGDKWEIDYGFDPKSADDGAGDFDYDGFTNSEEYMAGTDPTDPVDHPIPGDFDGNGKEDLIDFAIFASAWMSELGQANWNPACDISEEKDDVIDCRDLAVFASRWLAGAAAGPQPALPADLDYNGRVDMADYAIFAQAWMSQPGQANWNPACDISNPKDNIIDWKDLAVFAENWLYQTPAILMPDFDYDGDVDFDDLNRLTNYWLSPCVGPIWCEGCDLDKNSWVDFIDFSIFAQQWLEGISP